MNLKLLYSYAMNVALLFISSAVFGQLHFENFVFDGLGQPLLNNPTGVGISPEGNHVYVVSYDAGAINTYSRDESGMLTFENSIVNDVAGVSGISGAFAVMVSPEGNHVYVAGSTSSSVAVFARDVNTGALTFIEAQKNGENNVMGLGGVNNMAMSPDGNFVYVTGPDENAVVAFSRNVLTGALTFVQILQDENGDIIDLNYPVAVTVSPDGQNVYAASYGDQAVTVFSRNATTGLLSFQSVMRENANGVSGLGGAYSVKVSPDGQNLYCAGIESNAIVMFDRDEMGDLSFNTKYEDGINADGLFGANALTISEDGEFVFATGGNENALAIFMRDTNTGLLTYNTKFEEGVNGVSGLNFPLSITIAPDMKNIYVPGFGAEEFAVFEMDDMGKITFDYAETPGDVGVDGLAGAASLALSPTGNHIYVASENDHSIAIFDRNPTTGMMNYLGMQKDGENGVDGLEGANAVMVSPNGKFVYASGFWDNAIAVFARDEVSGMLAFETTMVQSMGGVDGIYGINSMTMSDDGTNLYATGFWDGTLAVFSVDPNTGMLTFMESFEDGVNGVDGLNRANSIVVSPDGASVYVTGSSDDAVALFSRDVNTGALTYVARYKNNIDGISNMDAPSSVVVSPAGDYVYVASNRSDALVVFTRNTMDGTLTYFKAYVNGMDEISGLDGITAVAVSTDGLFLYTTSNGDNSTAVFRKNTSDGTLSFEKSEQDGVNGVNGIGFGSDIKISESGRHIYVTGGGDNALALFSCTYLATLTEQICEGDSVVVGASIYKNSGVYQDTFEVGNCNNIITLELEVHPKVTDMMATICEGDVYEFGGVEYTTAGTYTKEYTSNIGCDSTVNLTLEVVDSFEPVMIEAEICAGDHYVLGTKAYDESGTYTQINLTDFGCEETTVLELSVLPVYDVQLTEVICEGDFYVFGTSNYTTTGTYTAVMTSKNGCDSLVTLNLMVVPNDGEPQTLKETICEGESFKFGGEEYTTTGVYTQTLSGSDCSAEFELDLTVLPAPPINYMEAVICEGDTYEFDGQMLAASGTFTMVGTSMNGCDSLTILTLEVEVANSHEVVVVCFGESYQFGNQTLTASGDYDFQETSMNNCMTNYTINFTVLDELVEDAVVTKDNGQETGSITPNITGGMAPYTYSWSNGMTTADISNLATGMYTLTVTDSNGCEMTFNFTVELSTATNDLEGIYEVKLYPNPVAAGATATLEVQSQETGRVQVALFDIAGKQLQEFPLQLNAGQNTQVIDAPGVSGLYLLRMVKEDGREQTFRFSVH